MSSDTPANQYRSYLLRLWQIKKNEGQSWRASLENTQTGELQGFADLDALLQYLHAFDESIQVEGAGTGLTKRVKGDQADHPSESG